MKKACEDSTQNITNECDVIKAKSKFLLEEVRKGGSFEEALIEFPDCYRTLMEISQMRFIALENHISDERCCALLGYDVASKLRTLVHSITQEKIVLLTLEPFAQKNITLLTELLKNKYPLHQIEFALTHLKDFYACLENLKIQEQIYFQTTKNYQEDEISYLYRLVIENSIFQKASDIHLESKLGYGSFKIRQDGKLREIAHIKREMFESLCNKIKLEAKLDISEKRLPQDGRYTFVVEGVEYDLRISSLPIQYGESIVIRILDMRSERISLGQLNLSPNNLDAIKKMIKAPHGIILIAGPTGSGKSTTLYAMLEEIKSNDKKLITIEDPIEYQINLATQIQINPDYGFDFPDALKAILRQDPDIIMVGEIRDQKTLELAIGASLTGHLVFSTIHTNDSVSTIDRLLNMGIEPYLLSSSLIGVISQRLARKLCPKCKRASKDTSGIFGQDVVVYSSSGCKECNMDGVSGREALMEVLEITPTIKHLISKNHLELHAHLKDNPFKTIFDDGKAKAMEGIVSIEEVYRLAKAE